MILRELRVVICGRKEIVFSTTSQSICVVISSFYMGTVQFDGPVRFACILCRFTC